MVCHYYIITSTITCSLDQQFSRNAAAAVYANGGGGGGGGGNGNSLLLSNVIYFAYHSVCHGNHYRVFGVNSFHNMSDSCNFIRVTITLISVVLS